jgi:16S rRNA (adenine1518-N6/adenine1519-N6)-dimethyltransferase
MLVSPAIAERLIGCCNLGPGSRVFEIGAGRGILTQRLAERTSLVKSFEIDRNLFEVTKKLVSNNTNVELLGRDAFQYDLKDERYDVCLTSLPYSESLHFIKWIARRAENFKVAVAIIQSEFAQKLIATPGQPNYRAISVISQIAFSVEILFSVGRASFRPPPKVESKAVRLWPILRGSQPFFDDDRIRILDFVFSFRGRLLSSALKKLLGDIKPVALSKELLSSRVETISPESYAEMLPQIEMCRQ